MQASVAPNQAPRAFLGMRADPDELAFEALPDPVRLRLRRGQHLARFGLRHRLSKSPERQHRGQPDRRERRRRAGAIEVFMHCVQQAAFHNDASGQLSGQSSPHLGA